MLRHFDIGIENNKITCKPTKIYHVPPDTDETFTVRLVDELVGKYQLTVEIEKKDAPITQDEINQTAIELHDQNRDKKGAFKFTVSLEPLNHSPEVEKLDPLIIND